MPVVNDLTNKGLRQHVYFQRRRTHETHYISTTHPVLNRGTH